MKQRGLAFKLSVLILTGGLLVLGLISGYNYWVVRRIVVKNVDENARNLTLTTVNRVQAVLSATEKAPQNLATVLEHSATSGADLFRLLRGMVENNPEIYGATVAFEPNAFDATAVYFAPYFYRRNGKIAFRQLGGEAYRYFVMDWYQIPKELGRPMWSEPYFDDGGGGIVMSTYSVPFYRTEQGERRFMGVVTADLSLQWLQAIVSSIRISQTGYAFLISRNGMLVTHPVRNLVMNDTIFTIAEARHDRQLRDIGRAMIHGQSGFVPTTSILPNRAAWLAYAPVPANGWSLGAVFPQDELMADVTSLNRMVLAMALGGGALLLLVVISVARSITRPLTALAHASEDIAQGNLDGVVPAATSADEVGRLTTSFIRMQRDLKRYIMDLRAASAAQERAAQQLAENNRTLEQRVTERTHELQGKNTELEQALQRLNDTQDQLVEQEKLASLGALTAGIAHEIKNPLNFVNNFAELSAELTTELRQTIDAQQPCLDQRTLQDIDDLLDDLEQNVRKINEHGKRADSIVRGMLQHSRGQAGERQPTDLNALLAEYVSLAYHGMRGQDASFNVTLETAYDPAVGSVSMVPQDISRVFLNILNNACYAVQQKRKRAGNGFAPTIWVRSRDLGERVEVRIRDNGEGIPAAVQDKIFTPFFTTKPAGAGTGLGLSIAYDIVVHRHRGELHVDSEEGTYAEFTIILPRRAGYAGETHGIIAERTGAGNPARGG